MMNHQKFATISTFIFDVDGVLTNSEILVTESGELLRKMNVRDGQAIKTALEHGYHVAIITKGNSKGVRIRLEGLGIKHIYDAQVDKTTAIKAIIKELNLSQEQILYMGDDIPDLAVFPYVGITTCPNDASFDLLSHAEYISPIAGGHGCAREIIERTLRIQNKWPIINS